MDMPLNRISTWLMLSYDNTITFTILKHRFFLGMHASLKNCTCIDFVTCVKTCDMNCKSHLITHINFFYHAPMV